MFSCSLSQMEVPHVLSVLKVIPAVGVVHHHSNSFMDASDTVNKFPVFSFTASQVLPLKLQPITFFPLHQPAQEHEGPSLLMCVSACD